MTPFINRIRRFEYDAEKRWGQVWPYEELDRADVLRFFWMIDNSFRAVTVHDVYGQGWQTHWLGNNESSIPHKFRNGNIGDVIKFPGGKHGEG